MVTRSFLLILCLSGLVAFSQVKPLDYPTAEKFAALPLECIEQEYPNKLNQVIADSAELLSPSELHPVFYGCFDWHSAVHGHWMLARLMNQFPDTELANEIEDLFDRQFTTRKMQIELLYFQPKHNQSYERTYGWAWLLKLYSALVELPQDKEHGWSSSIKSLTDHITKSYKEFLPKLVYPIRVGEHTNTAFGLSLALDYARIIQDDEFETLITTRSRDFYLNDKGCPMNWEPSGFDFISPCLQEAELMSKVLDKGDFKKWISQFMPDLMEDDFYIEPGKVIDRTDGKLVHLDGLNFSRAWCLYGLASKLPKNKGRLTDLGDIHLNASYDQVSGSDYMGSHWLASFLIYALEKRNNGSNE